MIKACEIGDIESLRDRITQCIGDADAAGLTLVAAYLETAFASLPRPRGTFIQTAFPSLQVN